MGYIYYGSFDLIGYGLILLGTVITIIAEIYVQTRYSKYKKVKNIKGLSGFEIARKILDNNGLTDVHIVETTGVLSDHYDPKRKVVRLSKDIFHGTTIASASVASHEVGHAIQDKEGYFFMRIRSAIVPFVNFASRFGYIAIMVGLIFGILNIAWAGVGLLLVILIFQLITLPVEFDASRRAIANLEANALLDVEEIGGSKSMLRAAAYTYVASLATTLLQLLRLVLIIMGRSDD